MSAPAIVVVGDVMADVLAHVTEPVAPAGDTPAAIALRPGGGGANTAAWLAHLGMPVILAGCVGDDGLGRDAERTLREGGVTTRLAVSAQASTGICLVIVDAWGERTMLPDAGANDRLTAGDLPGDALVAGGHLHVTGYTLMRPGSRAAGLAALAAARERGVPTSVDLSSSAPLARLGGAAVREMLAGVDLLISTGDEAEVLCGTREPSAVARDLLGEHAELLLKRGAGGAAWWGPLGAHHLQPAVAPPGPVIDTTGAGDAFAAAWLAARRAGTPPDRALASACALGALVTTRSGARPR